MRSSKLTGIPKPQRAVRPSFFKKVSKQFEMKKFVGNGTLAVPYKIQNSKYQIQFYKLQFAG